MARDWKKMYYNSLAIRIVAQDDASRRLELLRKVKSYLDWLDDDTDDSPFDIRGLEKELAKELANEQA